MRQTTRLGLGATLDNQRIMNLVEEALRQPPDNRRKYLEERCSGDSGDFDQAWHYVEWEQRMQGFLLEPLIQREADSGLEVGDFLENRFRIVRQVAQGGMGVVYEARDEKLQRRIALKCAKAGFGSELPPEVRHATEVSHPNVCKIYEIHTARVRQNLVDFITMEYLEGETLANRLKSGRIPQKEQFAIARQLVAGVAEAHRNGVIHGDIKSANVILAKAPDGGLRAVITDFGLARSQGSETRGIWGTPGYMAPELWAGQEPSPSSDIYALGVVFYEMAAGEMPDLSLASKARSDSLKATPWLEMASRKPQPVNARWDRILGKCLDPEPANRYQTADELADALTPGHTRRNILIAAAALFLAAMTGLLAYRGAVAPAETVKLAIAPLENIGGATVANPGAEIARLRGTNKIGFEVLRGTEAAKATHLLRVTSNDMGGQTAVHAVLSDIGTQTPLETWDARYGPKEWKYLPRALAGTVSEGLHLPPLPESKEVNASARDAYLAGTSAIQADSTLDAGLKNLEMAVAADADSPLPLAALAEGYWLKSRLKPDGGWLDRANEAYRQANLRYPDTATGHRLGGLFKQAAGRYDDAEAEFSRAIELQPRDSENYRRLGILYNRSNQFDKALAMGKKAVELRPDYFRNQASLGEFFLHQGSYREAIERLSEALRLMPSASVARFNRAMAYTDTGEFAKAEQDVTIVLNEGAKAQARFQLAKIRMYQGKDEEAVPALLQAVKETPNDYVYWMYLGIAQRRTGHAAEGRAAMQKGLEAVEAKLIANPLDGDPRSFLAYFCAQLGQKARARSEAAQALQLAPKEENVIWNAATAYESLGMRTQALEVLRKAAPETLQDLKRWPDVADLTADSRFKELPGLKDRR